MNKSMLTNVVMCLLVAALCVAISCYAQKPQRLWGVHDEERDRPAVITPPAEFGQPPSDAIVLFDGQDTSEWASDKGGPFKWKVENGYMEVAKKAGGIHTKKEFGNCQLHIEWWVPPGVDPKITDQKRSNSGVFLMGRYEVQILDSYTANNYRDNKTYADGQAAAIYAQYPPLVNACRKPGQWQSYDISFIRPLFDDQRNLVRPARITVFHNGVVVHNNVEIKGTTAHKKKSEYSPHGEGPIRLQDHGSPVRFRNIWIRELPEEAYLIR